MNDYIPIYWILQQIVKDKEFAQAWGELIKRWRNRWRLDTQEK